MIFLFSIWEHKGTVFKFKPRAKHSTTFLITINPPYKKMFCQRIDYILNVSSYMV